jgi:hypothetical protein
MQGLLQRDTGLAGQAFIPVVRCMRSGKTAKKGLKFATLFQVRVCDEASSRGNNSLKSTIPTEWIMAKCFIV